ncbi:MAG: ThuA domain-containing protein [Phycisphaerales bacterium]
MKSALFIWGGTDEHEPEKCVRLLADVLHLAGFSVQFADNLRVLTDRAKLRAVSVIVPCWNQGVITAEEEQNLLGAVYNGAGIAGWHGGMGDAFRAAAGYQFMVGGQFVAHPGNLVTYRVHITDHRHPISRGIPDFEITSEQFYMHVDPSNHVLANTRFAPRPGYEWIADTVMPVVWTRPWGRGRVFYSSIGRRAADFDVSEVRDLTRRGILWAAKSLTEI